MTKPDILVFMSDQHNPDVSSFAGGSVKTPNMERLCQDGTSFVNAYSSCPLCVPARVSMLLGKLPSKTSVFSNVGAIADTQATFLHAMAASGYETVLIGRMHFIGPDQRHGFTKRLVGDLTPVSWNHSSETLQDERGVYNFYYSEPFTLNVIGGGNSPVLEYDKAVVNAAKDYLAKQHDKPQCIFVSTYGPHAPYTAPPDRYLHYKKGMRIPDTFNEVPDYLNDIQKSRMIDVDQETMVKARAAYFGMIETIDEQLGEIRTAFDDYVLNNKREGVFAYLSDHGDQAGERKMFGKMTFFESSAKIPLMISGNGILKNQIVSEPSSIMDLGPTLCDLAGIKMPIEQDGISLASALAGGEYPADRAVYSELIDNIGGTKAVYQGRSKPIAARMVRQGRFKYVTYHGYENEDQLFDLINDPEEKTNIAADNPDVLSKLKLLAYSGWDPVDIEKQHIEYRKNIKLIKDWEKVIGPDETERWKDNPPSARVFPTVQ